MKKALLFFYLVIFTNFLFAQEYAEYHEIFVCKNPNGVVETLKVGATKVYYFSTVYPKKVELKTKYASNSIFVSFPNETKIYELSMGFMDLECISPDGSKQKFTIESQTNKNLGTYKTKTKNGVFEFLDFRYDQKTNTKNPSVYYWTSSNTKKITLISTNTSIEFEDEMKCLGNFLSCMIQFPNEKTIYKIDFKVTEESYGFYLICTNTKDNTTQRFDWIRK